MKPIASWTVSSDPHRRSDVEEFHARALRVVLGMLLLAPPAIAGAFIADYYGTAIELAALVPVLLVLTGAGYSLVARGSITTASLVTVIGLLVTLTLAVWLQPHTQLATFFCLIILIAAGTLGTRAGFATAGVAIGLVAAAGLAPEPVVGWDMALASIGLSAASAVLCWVATSPVYVALEWAWQSYDRARQTTEELRDRQGELGRIVKSLNEAYTQLEHLNDELARARQAAEEARRLKAQFAANISHELRTPLNLIIGFSEMMATAPLAYGGERLPDAYQSDLDAIQRNAQHLSGLIDDILDLSQIEAGRMGLVKERLALGDVVREAAAAVARLFDGKGLTIDVRVPDDLPLVYADRTRVRQVVINLLGNAARFTDEGGVEIRARTQGTDIIVSVADTGVGIAPEDLPRVFEEFRQFAGSGGRRAGGSGLGLAISKQFVELHGGSMWVESRLGEGTTFHFTLPLVETVVTASPPGGPQVWDRVMATRKPSPPQVRIVSSDSSAARIVRRHLDGYRVTDDAEVGDLPADGECSPDRVASVVIAPSPREAWLALEAGLRGTDGAPIVACALPGREDLAQALGVAAYLVKPITRSQVLLAIERAAGAPRSVLVVEDDPDMLRLLGRWVRSSRPACRAWLASGGTEAIAILSSRRPDAVLLDLVMPDVDGYAVLEAMRADDRLREVPVVAITARGREDEAVSAGLFGVTRQGGLTVAELSRCLRVTLDVLLVAPSAAAPTPAEAHPERPA